MNNTNSKHESRKEPVLGVKTVSNERADNTEKSFSRLDKEKVASFLGNRTIEKKAGFLRTESLKKTFKTGDISVDVLKGVDLDIDSGDFVIIFGPSGCGKSTLLHSLLGLERPSEGKVIMDGKDFYSLNEDERALFRRHRVGIVYQQPLWISSLDVFDNVVFSLHLLNYNQDLIEKKAKEVLDLVGMYEWAHYRPTELSSGQQQKVGLARSLIIDPVLIVADEPTGNLDTSSGEELIQTFLELHKQGITIVMVTHDLEYLPYANKIIHMVDGEIVEKYTPKNRKTNVRVKGKKEGGALGVDATVRDPDYLKKLNL